MLQDKFSGAKLRDRKPLDTERLSRLVDAATLMPVDRYFMQIRRDLMMLERPVGVASYYNWIQVGESGLTPAERFGIAKGKIRHQDIVHYD